MCLPAGAVSETFRQHSDQTVISVRDHKIMKSHHLLSNQALRMSALENTFKYTVHLVGIYLRNNGWGKFPTHYKLITWTSDCAKGGMKGSIAPPFFRPFLPNVRIQTAQSILLVFSYQFDVFRLSQCLIIAWSSLLTIIYLLHYKSQAHWCIKALWHTA